MGPSSQCGAMMSDTELQYLIRQWRSSPDTEVAMRIAALVSRSCDDSKPIIDVELLEELQRETQSLMCHFHYNRDGSDWSCLYCGNEPPPRSYVIEHRDDCFGVKLTKRLDEVQGALDD